MHGFTCPSSAPGHCKGSVSVLRASVFGPARRSGTAKAAAFGRATYTVQPGKSIVVTEIATGYRPKQLATLSDPALAAHRALASLTKA